MAEGSFFLIQPHERRLVQGKFAGTVRHMIVDEKTPSLNFVTGTIQILDTGSRIPLHHHAVEEFQFIIRGHGVVRDSQGQEYPVTPGTSVYCLPGADGAHEFENTGTDPLEILFVFHSPGGLFPQIDVDAQA